MRIWSLNSLQILKPEDDSQFILAEYITGDEILKPARSFEQAQEAAIDHIAVKVAHKMAAGEYDY